MSSCRCACERSTPLRRAVYEAAVARAGLTATQIARRIKQREDEVAAWLLELEVCGYVTRSQHTDATIWDATWSVTRVAPWHDIVTHAG